MADTPTRLKALNGFLAKSDGRDKLTATIQYACMFLSAGEPGNIKKVQTSVAAARKVFRILRPLENLVPVLTNPKLSPNKPVAVEVLIKLKSILMAIYFGADHVVWASQAGIYTDKESIDRWQKVSLWTWFGGSVCGILTELNDVAALTAVPKEGETQEEWCARQMKTQGEVNTKLLTIFHGLTQAALAVGLLGLRPWSPRTVGAIGTLASAINCYMLFPALPSSKAAAPTHKPQSRYASPALLFKPELKLA
ncbi:hypothetical protein WJX74_006549 [Apatococcus lobatus]|uniref:Peroxisomal membrane protein 11C n=1 Tax=Apatococcus lobatus TaxID=904363 RepID=A0AAW1SBQ0_9CHLO